VPAKVKRTYSTTPKGVGRKDYSLAVEMAVNPVISSWQRRYQWYLETDLPAYPSAAVGAVFVFRAPDGTSTIVAPETPVYIYDVFFSITRHALAYIDLRSYLPDLTDMQPIAEDEGYGRVHLKFERGLRVVPGRIYIAALLDCSGKPGHGVLSAFGVESAEVLE